MKCLTVDFWKIVHLKITGCMLQKLPVVAAGYYQSPLNYTKQIYSITKIKWYLATLVIHKMRHSTSVTIVVLFSIHHVNDLNRYCESEHSDITAV